MRIVVYGKAEPQGSKRPFHSAKTGKTWVAEVGGAKHKNWREAIAQQAQVWLENHPAWIPIDGPVRLSISFHLPKPKSAKKGETWAIKRPDLDKLVRAVGDALHKKAYTEDSRIVQLSVSKQYAIDTAPCADILVEAIA